MCNAYQSSKLHVFTQGFSVVITAMLHYMPKMNRLSFSFVLLLCLYLDNEAWDCTRHLALFYISPFHMESQDQWVITCTLVFIHSEIPPDLGSTLHLVLLTSI